MSNTLMGLAKNEEREQNIIKLRMAFKHNEVFTIHQAAVKFAKAESTVKKWAKDGNIPLIIDNLHPPVVKWTNENQPDNCPTNSGPGDGWIAYLKATKKD